MIPIKMGWLTTEKIVFLCYLDYSHFQFVSNVDGILRDPHRFWELICTHTIVKKIR